MKIYDLFGENRPSMEVTRRAVRFASGWVRESVQEAGKEAAEVLATMVQPFAGPIFEEHRAAGRPLVLATTTPYDLIKPLADALGFDDVIATRYATAPDGRYDGTFDGEFVWGPGQAAGHLGLGRRTRDRPGPELRLLGQLLRPPDAVGGRPPRRGQPGPPPHRDGPAPAVAHRAPRRPVGRPQDPGGGHRATEGAPGAGAPRAVPLRPLRHLRRRAPAQGRPGHRRRQPPELLRPGRHGLGAGQAGPAGALPRQEGGVRRTRRGPDRQGHGRDPRRAGLRLRRAAGRRGGRAAGRRGRGADAPGHDPPRQGRSSPRRPRAAGAPPGWPR